MKYEHCETYWFKDEHDQERCDKCEIVDLEFGIEPPSEWKYEDPEGEWK